MLRRSLFRRGDKAIPMPATHDDAINMAAPVEPTVSKQNVTEDIEEGKPDALVPAQDAQNGVQQIEAVTLTWSKQHMIAAYVW